MALNGFLKQSTAATVRVGPFVDSTDGVTAETAFTISQADVRLSKNGAAAAQKNQASAATHDENGYYSCSLDTTDTNTLGILTLTVSESGGLPVRHDFAVMPSNVYDSLFSTDLLQVHLAEMTADIITAASIAANAIGSAEIADGAITAAKIATDAIDADALATDAVTEIKNAVLTLLQDKTHTGVLLGGTSTTLTLASAASSVDDTYNNALVFVISATGVVQVASISDYVGSTRVATTTPAFTTVPDTTYRYVVVGQ